MFLTIVCENPILPLCPHWATDHLAIKGWVFYSSSSTFTIISVPIFYKERAKMLKVKQMFLTIVRENPVLPPCPYWATYRLAIMGWVFYSSSSTFTIISVPIFYKE